MKYSQARAFSWRPVFGSVGLAISQSVSQPVGGRAAQVLGVSFSPLTLQLIGPLESEARARRRSSLEKERAAEFDGQSRARTCALGRQRERPLRCGQLPGWLPGCLALDCKIRIQLARWPVRRRPANKQASEHNDWPRQNKIKLEICESPGRPRERSLLVFSTIASRPLAGPASV